MEFRAANGKLSPGVRFHPTDVELVMHYLKKKVLGKPLEAGLVAEVDIYQFHPADLRDLACFNKELHWYFFCAIGKKYGSGDRKNRSTQSGFWKPTGNSRAVIHKARTVGNVKTLVFHQGKPRNGERTDWVMYEYRVEESELGNSGVSDAIVLCKIFKKGGWGPRNGEQYGAPYNEEEWYTEEENNTLVPVAVQDQSASVVMNDLVSASVNLLHTTEKVYSGAVSVSGVHQAPALTSDVANDQAVDKMSDAIPKPAVDVASSSGGLVPNNVDGMCCADDFGGIFDKLDNIEDLGMYLDDLERPLFP